MSAPVTTQLEEAQHGFRGAQRPWTPEADPWPGSVSRGRGANLAQGSAPPIVEDTRTPSFGGPAPVATLAMPPRLGPIRPMPLPASPELGVVADGAAGRGARRTLQERSFHDLAADLISEYDRVRSRLSELCSENANLRGRLARQGTEVLKLRSQGVSSRARAFASGGSDSGYSERRRLEAVRPPVQREHRPFRHSSSATSAALGWTPPQPTAPESPRPPPEGEAARAAGAPPGDQPVNRTTTGDSPEEVEVGMRSPKSTCTHQESVLGNQVDVHQAILRLQVSPSDTGFSTSSFLSLPEPKSPEGIAEHEAELELLPVWMKSRRRRRLGGSTSSAEVGRGSSLSTQEAAPHRSRSVLDDFNEEAPKPFLQRFMLRPSSRKAMGWDVFTLTVLVWDLIVIPLQVFELPEIGLWTTMELLATVTWTMDLLLSFFKGYESGGEVVLKPNMVWKNYLRTWFVFDVSIVSMDWALLVFQSGDLVDWLRFSRFRRALRLLRLARLVKHGSKFITVANTIRSEDLLVVLRVLWLLILLIAINHFIACGWYAIGTSGLYDVSWTSIAFVEEAHFGFRYTTSFHWSVTQFTPASMEVVPRNTLERAYNIICIFFGLLMFSSFVSNMTNSMTYLTKRNYEKKQQRDLLTSYMSNRGLSLELKNDIAMFLAAGSSSAKKKKRNRAMQESDIASLRMLPEILLERLHAEIHSQVLREHSFFSRLIAQEPAIVEKLCHHGMREVAHANGTELFRFGTRCSKMYFTVSGESVYTIGYGGEAAPLIVHPHQWLAEPCLWVVWEHRGRLNAKEPIEVSELDSAEFQTIVSRSSHFDDIQRYAKMYIARAELECGGAEGITDIWGQRIRVMDLSHKAFCPDEAFVMSWTGGSVYTKERLFRAWKRYADIQRDIAGPGVCNWVWRKLYSMGYRH